jgi:tRNA1Val (adenine37-N6)-methyltransferase
MLNQDYKPVLLPFGKTIFQTSFGQPISTDTSNLVKIILEKEKNNDKKVLELGTGNGIISLLLSYYRPNWQIDAFDIQENLINLAKKNMIDISENINFFVDDIKSPKNIPNENYDLIFGNPPFFQIGKSRISPIYERAISRNEILCEMDDILRLIKNKLSTSGKSYLIYPEFRLEEFQKKILMFNFRISNITIIQNTKNKFIAEFIGC